jgi:simple sugar transport system permease protein
MDLVEFFQVFFLTSSALLLASLSGLLSERSGVVNISIEGTMIMGATTYLFVMDPAGLAMYQMLGAGAVPIAAMIAGLVGMLFGLLLGTISVKFMGDQVIAGTALNLLAPILFLIVSLNVTGSAGD